MIVPYSSFIFDKLIIQLIAHVKCVFSILPRTGIQAIHVPYVPLTVMIPAGKYQNCASWHFCN
jgi:hypothetical protein